MSKNKTNTRNLFNKSTFQENLKTFSKEYDRHVSNKKNESSNNKQPDNDSVTRGGGSIHGLTNDEFYAGGWAD